MESRKAASATTPGLLPFVSDTQPVLLKLANRVRVPGGAHLPSAPEWTGSGLLIRIVKVRILSAARTATTHRLWHVTPVTMKLHVSLHKTHRLRDETWSWHIEVYTQPTWRRLVHRTYHWYDMRIFKVPGFKRLERWLEDRHKGDPELYVPLSCQQDIRCYELGVRGKKQAALIEITKEQYDKISKAREGLDPNDTF